MHRCIGDGSGGQVVVGQLYPWRFLSWITIWESDEATRSIQRHSGMENGGRDKYVTNHPAHCSYHVWVRCSVRFFHVFLFSFINIIFSLSISPIQASIGYVVGAILVLGLTTLLVTSLASAFCAACPFRSSFSTTIQFIFKSFQNLSRWMCQGLSQRKIRWLWIGSLTFLWVISCALIAYASMVNSTGFLALVCIPIAVTIAYAAHEEITHKPQEYKIPHLVFMMFIIIAPPLAAIPPFTGWERRLSYPVVFTLYGIGVLVLFFTGWMGSRMAKSMVEAGEVDAIAWVLTSTSSQDPESFKKAGQIASLGTDGPHYRPRLLKSLMPLLSLLITSHRNDRIDMLEGQQMHHLEIYVSCLAILSDFEDYEGSFWLMREDARRHPKLDLDPKEEPLRNKLVEFARNPRYSLSLRSASAKVLDNYKLDTQGNDILWSVLLPYFSKYEHLKIYIASTTSTVASTMNNGWNIIRTNSPLVASL